MAQTDRAAGLIANSAVKGPCRVATTADITLSGLQTIDGVTLVADDRVLVKEQSDGTENGIYLADTGDWVRAKDANGAYDLVTGSLVFVRSGSTANGFYYLTTTGTITIDSSTITWAAASSVLSVISAFGQTLVDDTSAQAARQTLLLDKHGADIASAGTVDLDAATGDLVDITGTTNITAITLSEGVEKTVRFAGSLLLSNGASLILKDSADMQTAAGDFAVFRGYASGVVRMVDYQRLQEHGSDVASATTTNLNTATGELIDITGTTTITGITLAEGKTRTVRFTGILTLTHGASLVLPGQANITTAVGDYAIFKGYGSSVVRCVIYNRLSGESVVGVQVGDLLYSFAGSRSGYLLLAGQTVGSAASGADDASDDYESIFTFIWTNVADSEAPVSSGRGASAAADWAANKTITFPDCRGRVLLGADNMGGSSADVATDTEADTIGDVGGEEDHTQTEPELVGHTHTYTAPTSGGTSAVNPAFTASGGSTTGSTGGGTAFNIMQPYLTINVFIRY